MTKKNWAGRAGTRKKSERNLHRCAKYSGHFAHFPVSVQKFFAHSSGITIGFLSQRGSIFVIRENAKDYDGVFYYNGVGIFNYTVVLKCNVVVLFFMFS